MRGLRNRRHELDRRHLRRARRIERLRGAGLHEGDDQPVDARVRRHVGDVRDHHMTPLGSVFATSAASCDGVTGSSAPEISSAGVADRTGVAAAGSGPAWGQVGAGAGEIFAPIVAHERATGSRRDRAGVYNGTSCEQSTERAIPSETGFLGGLAGEDKPCKRHEIVRPPRDRSRAAARPNFRGCARAASAPVRRRALES